MQPPSEREAAAGLAYARRALHFHALRPMERHCLIIALSYYETMPFTLSVCIRRFGGTGYRLSSGA